MEKFLALEFLSLLLCGIAKAVPMVAEAPVLGYGTPATVAISSTTMTKIPTSQTSGRIGIFLDNPATNSQRIVGFIGDCTSTAIATTVRPLEFSPGNNSAYIPIREDVCLWLLSLDTSASTANVHYQEVKQ